MAKKKSWWRRWLRWAAVAAAIFVVSTTTTVLFFRYVPIPVSALMIQRRIIGSAMELDVDKAGRIGISALLREHAGLAKDCVVMGIRNYLEIWDETTYAAYQKMLDETMPSLVGDLNVSWPKE